MLSILHMPSFTHTHTHTHIPIHTWAKTAIGCQLDVHCFSLVIFGNLAPQTDSTHNPCGQLAIPPSVCVCVGVCVYPASSSSCVSNSSLSCRLMTELRERDSNMDRCLTPFSPDLETTGQTPRTHTHTHTHTNALSLPLFLFWWL